ncbi:hypothetical protein [Paraburkholderia unamae]|uniref:Uncharacterized protein n=1 Tax=Paraburkholderia unamae TaxID=219649 RepID=A0ACC6RP62_9BURK
MMAVTRCTDVRNSAMRAHGLAQIAGGDFIEALERVVERLHDRAAQHHPAEARAEQAERDHGGAHAREQMEICFGLLIAHLRVVVEVLLDLRAMERLLSRSEQIARKFVRFRSVIGNVC